MNPENPVRVEPHIGDDQSDDDARFTVTQPAEIVFVLKKIMQNRQMVTAYLNGGAEFALTSLLDVRPEEGEVILDVASDATLNKRLLESEKVLFVTSHDQVKIKLGTSAISEVRHEGRPALRIPMPRTLVRIQRREHYRIATPITKPLICALPMPDRGPGAQAETILLDISIGGVALMDNHGDTVFEIGNKFDNCRIGLPEVGTLVVTLEVCNAHNTPLKNGLNFRRCGCRFVNLQPQGENLVQRYIMHLERSRHFKAKK